MGIEDIRKIIFNTVVLQIITEGFKPQFRIIGIGSSRKEHYLLNVVLLDEMLAHILRSLVIIGAYIAYAFSSSALHNDRYAGCAASGNDIVSSVLIIDAASKDHRAVKIMQVREIEYVHLAILGGFGITRSRITDEQEYIGIFRLESILHAS